MMLDGVAENHTAAMLEPYLDAGGCSTGQSGLDFIDPDELPRFVTALDREGFQVHFHALGDRAVRNALNAVAAARSRNGRPGGRHHLAHLQVVHPDDIPRFAGLGATANIQPLWATHEPQMDELTIPFLGERRAGWQYPFGSLQAAGAALYMREAATWPVSSPDPLAGVHVGRQHGACRAEAGGNGARTRSCPGRRSPWPRAAAPTPRAAPGQTAWNRSSAPSGPASTLTSPSSTPISPRSGPARSVRRRSARPGCAARSRTNPRRKESKEER